MKTFFDSSAFTERYIEESGSNVVEEPCSNATESGLSIICVPEIMSAPNRRIRKKSLTQKQYDQAKALLAKEVADATITLSLILDIKTRRYYGTSNNLS